MNDRRQNNGLKRFGHYMAGLRREAGLKQSEVCTKAEEIIPTIISDAELPTPKPKSKITTSLEERFASSFSQTAINRLENGDTTFPKPFFLKGLAKIYDEDLENVLGAYIGCLYFDDGSASVSSVEEIDPFFISNATRIFSLDSIFTWESNLVKNSNDSANVTLWIISPQFVDHERKDVLAMVVDDLILQGCDITYFIGEDATKPGQGFDTFLTKAALRILKNNRTDDDYASLGKIDCYGLSKDELTWFTSSMVIGNPDDLINDNDTPEGFLIVSISSPDGILKPSFGTKMSKMYTVQVIMTVRRLIQDRKKNHQKNGLFWRSDSLKAKIMEISNEQ